MPTGFKALYLNTRVAIYCTEITMLGRSTGILQLKMGAWPLIFL